MSDRLIRRATSSDEPFLFDMVYEALFVAPGDDPFPRSVLDVPQIAHYAKGFGRAGDLGLVAEAVDGVPELSIAVVVEHRGTGLGTELLTRLIAEVPRCCSSVDRRNPPRRLYERLGFESVSRSGDSITMLRDGG